MGEEEHIMVDEDIGDSRNQEFDLSLSRRSVLALIGLGAIVEPNSGRSVQKNAANRKSMNDSEADLLNDEQISMSIDEVLPGDKFGRVTIGELSHTLTVSGTRRPSWMIQPFSEDVHTTSTTYEDTEAEVGYGFIPFAPGHVPVLRIVGHFDNPVDATASIRVSIANRPAYHPPRTSSDIVLDDDPPRRTLLEVTGKGRTQTFDEVYLSDVKDVVTGFRNSTALPSHTLLFEVKMDHSCEQATISNATTVALELEAL
jgi:hypothetical protein